VDGKKAFSGSDDRTARLWEVDTAKQLQQFTGHENGIRAVALNEKGNWALTGGADATVRLWQTATGKELGKFTKHLEPVVQVAFLDNGKQTLSGSRDNALLLWSIEKFYPVTTEPKKEYPKELPPLKANTIIPVDGTVGRLILSPNKKWLFYLDRSNNRIGQIEAPTFKHTQERKKLDVCSMALTPDGKTLYAVGSGSEANCGTIYALDPITMKVRTSSDVLEKFSPYDLAASNDGKLYLTEAASDTLRVWDITAEKNDSFTGSPASSLIQLSVKQDRLFVMPQRWDAPGMTMWDLNGGKDSAPLKLVINNVKDYPLGGELVLSPEGRFLLCSTGSVFWLDPQWNKAK
jgi:WD40 repeat protein